MTPRFHNANQTAALARDGYVVFPGLFAEVVPELRAIYRDMRESILPTDPYFECPMTGTNFLGDRQLRRRINEGVLRVVAPGVATVLPEHRFVGAGFRVKQTGPSSLLCLHQDPTMVDEAREWSINIIVPLIDTTAENGALRVIPGSHHYLPAVRSMNLNDRSDMEGDRVDEEIAELVEVIPMRAGDAIFYFNALLHGSGPNATTEHRPVVLGTIMSRDTSMVLYLRNAEEPSIVERYEVPDDFFVQLENFDRDFKKRPANGRQLDDVHDPHILTRDELLARIRAGARARAAG